MSWRKPGFLSAPRRRCLGAHNAAWRRLREIFCGSRAFNQSHALRPEAHSR
ncbi:hypothetical protein USDA257_c44210 [Sinorhizobium fredii USDA 257]|uniref:Uncharacterized protein n=1 Tax=Sinorhizobium fredii (strain USDA 257) TaxID=1185652 RepID=I3XAQ3_SINF2|nr:hypothetical protein USDA257_c44210 [Sinorhizobium fredii USDA 257]